MARIFLAICFATAGLNFLYPKFCDLLRVEPVRFVDLVLYVPAVVMGCWHWTRGRTFGSSWPVLVCAGIVWAGLLFAGNTESSRGLYIAALLTIVLPVSALIAESRLWLFCARTYVFASAASLALSMWFEAHARSTGSYLFVLRFGFLHSEDGHARLANPNQIGGQMALAAVLALILYLNDRAATGRQDQARRSGGFSLGWTVWLSMGCLLTASRGAFGAWFAGMSMLLFWGTRSQSPQKLQDLVSISMLGAVLVALATVAGRWTPWENLRSRFVDNRSVGSLGSRTEIWKRAYQAWRSTPDFTFRGTGTGMADEVLARFDPFSVEDQYGVLRKNCHNAFVEWVLSFGLVGMAPGFCLLVTMFYKARVLDQAERNVGRLAILSAVVLYAMTAVIYRQPQWMATGSLVLAMLSGSPARQRASRHRANPARDRAHAAIRLDAPTNGIRPAIPVPSTTVATQPLHQDWERGEK